MAPLFGEFECKVDAKGRFLLPAALLRQLPEGEQQEFVINRGLDNCLVLYPIKVWEAELVKIMSLNQFVKENRDFARKFQAGATPLTLDSAKRVLVPRRLAEWAGIDKDTVLIGAMDKVEIWATERYTNWLNNESAPLEHLAEQVMAGRTTGQ